MKKLFRLFAALCLAAVLCVPLAACEWGSEPGGSENGGNSGDPSAVRTTVTEEEQDAAVYLVGIGINDFLYHHPKANVTIVSAASMTDENGEGGKPRIEVQIDGNKVFVELMDDGFFGSESEKMTQCYVEILERLNDEESFMANVYSKDENGQWTVTENEFSFETDKIYIADEYVEMYDFENYTYNASLRQYEAKDLEFDSDEEFGMSLTIDFMTFQFENGKLIREEAQYGVELGDVSVSVVGSVTYSYGTASVTLPVVGD